LLHIFNATLQQSTFTVLPSDNIPKNYPQISSMPAVLAWVNVTE